MNERVRNSTNRWPCLVVAVAASAKKHGMCRQRLWFSHLSSPKGSNSCPDSGQVESGREARFKSAAGDPRVMQISRSADFCLKRQVHTLHAQGRARPIPCRAGCVMVVGAGSEATSEATDGGRSPSVRGLDSLKIEVLSGGHSQLLSGRVGKGLLGVLSPHFPRDGGVCGGNRGPRDPIFAAAWGTGRALMRRAAFFSAAIELPSSLAAVARLAAPLRRPPAAAGAPRRPNCARAIDRVQVAAAANNFDAKPLSSPSLLECTNSRQKPPDLVAPPSTPTA